jgi:alkanesulfonate monooxygenase SsuD/methylene tetrahydromethanopterin reductase-like flavin-dependent oxidoreductase (luciferase family)
MPVEIGLGFWNMQAGYTHPVPWPTLYREAVDEVRLAEAMGFDAVWIAEHHFSYDGYCPSPLASASYLAAATTTVKIGTCIMALPLHDPQRVSGGISTVASLSGNRFRFGAGLGYREIEFTTFGRSLRKRGRALEESIDLLRTDGCLDGVELWLGGITAAAILRAARYGASVFVPPSAGGPEEIAALRRTWLEARAASEGAEPRFALFLQIYPTTDAAYADYLSGVTNEEWRAYSRFFVEDPVLGSIGAGRDEIAAQFTTTSLIGPPAMIVERLAEFRRAGIDTFILWPRFGALPHQDVRLAIERIATDIVPALREAS